MVERLLHKLQKLEELCRADEGEENYRHHQFVLLCESFLQMYSGVFQHLSEYILGETNGYCWNRKTHPYVPFIDEEFKDFQVNSTLFKGCQSMLRHLIIQV